MKLAEEELKKILPENGPTLDEVQKYIEKYKNDLIVIKYGGNVFIDRNIFNNFISDLSILKKLGLSTNKAKTIKELSYLFLNDKVYDLSKLNDMDLNESLLSVFGIGPWSINMFEIFSLGKLDIFTSKDAGLRLAMNRIGLIDFESNWDIYDDYAAKWSPFRTIASIHLWKFVDG